MSLKLSRTALLLIVAGACAKSAPPATSADPSAEEPSRAQATAPVGRNRDIIAKDELQDPANAGRTVLEVVRSLRPHFLTIRGGQSMRDTTVAKMGLGDDESGKVHASIDGNKIVALEELTPILASTVNEVRFLNPAQAMNRFGGSARSGPVILVTTVK